MIEATFFLEAQGNSKGAVEQALRNLMAGLKKERGARVSRESVHDTEKDGDRYSVVGEADANFEDLTSYLLAAIKYGPSAIEVRGPDRLIVSAQDFLKALGEVIAVAKTFYARYGIGFKFSEKGGEIGLDEEEIEGLRDQGALRVKIVVEAKDKSSRAARNALVGALSGDAFVNKTKTKKMTKEKGFDGLVGIEAYLYEPKALLDIAVKHTPVLIEILEPEEIELSMLDLQDMGVDLAAVFFEASHMVLYTGLENR